MTLFHILSLILFYHVSRQQSIVFALSLLYYYLKKSHQLELSLQIVWFLIGSEPSAVSHSISSCASLLTNLYFSAIKPIECPSTSHFPPAKRHRALACILQAGHGAFFFYFRDLYFRYFFFSYSCRAVKASPDRG